MPDIDLFQITQDPYQLFPLVALVTAWLAKRLNWHGNWVVGLSFGVSIALVGLGYLSTLVPWLIDLGILVFVGAVGAGGAKDFLDGVLKPRVQIIEPTEPEAERIVGKI